MTGTLPVVSNELRIVPCVTHLDTVDAYRIAVGRVASMTSVDDIATNSH